MEAKGLSAQARKELKEIFPHPVGVDVLDLTVTEGSYLIGSCDGGGFDAVLARAPERV